MTFAEKYKQIMKMTEDELTQEDVNELIDLAETRLDMAAIEQFHRILIHQKLKNKNIGVKNG